MKLHIFMVILVMFPLTLAYWNEGGWGECPWGEDCPITATETSSYSGVVGFYVKEQTVTLNKSEYVINYVGKCSINNTIIGNYEIIDKEGKIWCYNCEGRLYEENNAYYCMNCPFGLYNEDKNKCVLGRIEFPTTMSVLGNIGSFINPNSPSQGILVALGIMVVMGFIFVYTSSKRKG